MKARTEIIKQQSVNGNQENHAVRILEKDFVIAPVSDALRILVHEDYPLIDESDVQDFIAYCQHRKRITISASRAKVHPYRLMYIDDQGHDSHLLDIPQTVRGNRHSYPEVYQSVPALVAIPPNTPVSTIDSFQKVDLYLMPFTKLLDQSILYEKLLIQSLRKFA